MRPTLKALSGISLAVLATACVTERVVVHDPGPRPYQPPPPAYIPEPFSDQPVVSMYIEPPIGQPEPVACPWAPPPMLVELPPSQPFEGAIWTGGYWVWHGTWVWAHGRWEAPPRPMYHWHPPYYEHRDNIVIFVTGHWGAPGTSFAPPPPGMRYEVERAAPGVRPGPPPMGPQGCFVPPPPGSHRGIIVPAPVGTAPAVVTGAPPVVNVGMRITNTPRNGAGATHVLIVAPPSATANGQAVNASAPTQAHLAAAMPSAVGAHAPQPPAMKPVPAFVPGQRPAVLPPPQQVRPAAPQPAAPPPQRALPPSRPGAPQPVEPPRNQPAAKPPAAPPQPVKKDGPPPKDEQQPRPKEERDDRPHHEHDHE